MTTNAERAVIEAARKLFATKEASRLKELSKAVEFLELEYLGQALTEPEKPKRVRDGDGDIWHLCADGYYSLYADRVDAKWTIEEIRDTYSPVTVLSDDECLDHALTEPEKPKRVRDREGDVWYLCRNGGYSLYMDREASFWSLDAIQDHCGPLTVLSDDE